MHFISIIIKNMSSTSDHQALDFGGWGPCSNWSHSSPDLETPEEESTDGRRFFQVFPPPGIKVWLSFWCFLFLKFSSVAQLCPTPRDPMNHSTPCLPVHHQLPESTQTCVQRVGDAIQPSRPLSSPSPPAPNPSQHPGLFQWVSSSHEVAKVLEFQLQRQSFQ